MVKLGGKYLSWLSYFIAHTHNNEWIYIFLCIHFFNFSTRNGSQALIYASICFYIVCVWMKSHVCHKYVVVRGQLFGSWLFLSTMGPGDQTQVVRHTRWSDLPEPLFWGERRFHIVQAGLRSLFEFLKGGPELGAVTHLPVWAVWVILTTGPHFQPKTDIFNNLFHRKK